MKLNTVAFLFVCAVAGLLGGTAVDADELTQVVTGTGGVLWGPLANYAGLELTVVRPDGQIFQKSFPRGASPYYDLAGSSKSYPNGLYAWELRVASRRAKRARDDTSGAATTASKPKLVQSGHFSVNGGIVVDPGLVEGASYTKDILHYDDVIVTSSLCVGFDCVNGESFGFDTFRLKENNLRIHFQDTSTSASFPTNDWRIGINDSSNGGASYFAIQDVDHARTPFLIEAGAPSNSLYVEDYGRVGFGTSTPAVELHVRDSDTPTLRLEQDGSSGWTPQTWDMAGNETNFFIRDVTNGSKLPFRIRPGAPTSSIDIATNGNIGFGTSSPGKALDVERTGANAELRLTRTDGVQAYISAGTSAVGIGSATNSEVYIMLNRSMAMRFYTHGAMSMANGAVCSTAGVWQDASSRDLKENIETLGVEEATKTLAELSPMKYNYKKEKGELYLGFIAEDVPDLVASKDRKNMSPMDVTAVLTKVLQEQQKVIAQLQGRIEALEQNAAAPEAQ